ncbi:hypothetical protein HPB50_028560 [Hyalomma asiaticum]|nr:hypothetical protein HPB50_028560 [Hyalomma asiaticum]
MRAITETSICNDNDDLWKFVVPDSGPFTWVSAAVATRLATTGLEWVRLLGRENSGTKMTRYEDVSRGLRDNKYWASYNIAYFSDVFNISEQLPKVMKYGDYYTYENAPRAKIFRRDHVKVKDMNSMIKLMRQVYGIGQSPRRPTSCFPETYEQLRCTCSQQLSESIRMRPFELKRLGSAWDCDTYNDFKNDPLSRCNCTPPYNPTYAIAPRYDLIDPQGTYDIPEMYPRAVGGIDVKVTNYTLFLSRQFVGVSGPTWDNQPPFQWSNSGFLDSHIGHPDKWQFEPVIRKWEEPRVKWFDKRHQPTNTAASRMSWTVYLAQLYAASSIWHRQSPLSS